MAKGLEKEYYKLPQEDFSKLLEKIRNDPRTVHFFSNTDTPYFILPDSKMIESLLQLHRDRLDFDAAFNEFSAFGKKQLVQSFLIREIESTNGIENIHSTRHDIFELIQSRKNGRDKKLVSIVNGYLLLLNEHTDSPTDLQQLRYLYDRLLKGAIEKEDKPDGEYFRKKPVYITDGLKNVHRGFYPEKMINEGMQEFLDLQNDSKIDLFERLILSHFLFETVHPFYDGNGRFGRFLITQKYFNETGSYLALGVSTAFNHRKKHYYKALDEARHEHMYGSLNTYVEDIVDIIHTYNQDLISELKEKKSKIDMLAFSEETFTRSEREILKLMAESSLLSDFGISNAEIIEYTGISKRTVISSMQKFRQMDLLEETKFSKTVYHKLHNVNQAVTYG